MGNTNKLTKSMAPHTTTTSSSSSSSSSTVTAQASALLSAASTPAGGPSAYCSPSAAAPLRAAASISAAVQVIVNKSVAPKKLLPKREAPRAWTKIASRTIFPETFKPVKVGNKAPIVRGPEDTTPIIRRTAEEEDAEVARNLPAIDSRKKDKYGNPWFRTWSPAVRSADGRVSGGCPAEDHIVVLVHFRAMGLETEETKPKDRYMSFAQLKQHCK